MALTWNDLPKPGSDDHKWSQIYAQFQQSGDVQGYLNYLQTQRPQDWAQWQASHPGTGTGGTDGTGGTGGTGSGGGTGAVPLGTPTPIMAPALNYSGRFGTYNSPAYQVGTSYAGPESPPGAPGAPTATPPAPVGGNSPPVGAPTPVAAQPGTQPTGNIGGTLGGNSAPNSPNFPPNPAAGGGLLSSGGGNSRSGGLLSSGQGGASGGGGFTGNTGGNAAGGQGAAGAPTGDTSAGFMPNDYISMGVPAQVALSLASHLPGVYGLPATVAGLGMRAYNTFGSNSMNEGMGLGGLDLGQWAGGILGLNRYGSFSDPQIANRDAVSQATGGKLNAGISPGGYYDPGFFARMFGDEPATEYTPTEFANRRYAVAHAPQIIGGIGQTTPRAPVPTDPGAAAPWQRDPNLAMGDHGGYGGGDTSAGGGYGNSGNAAKADGTAAGGRSTDAGGGYSADGGNYKGFRKGGFVPGKPDAVPDNRPVNADEGEFVVKKSAAKAAGKGLLRSLNTPAGAKKMRGLLRSA